MRGRVQVTRSTAALCRRAIIDRKTIHIHDLAEEPEMTCRQRSLADVRCSDCSCHAAAAGGNSHRGDRDPPHGGPSLHRQTDQTARDLRRSSGDRHRERAVVQGNPGAQRRIARSPGASDRNEPRCWASSAARPRTAAGLDAIVESAARVCGIDDVLLRLNEAGVMSVRAHVRSGSHSP